MGSDLVSACVFCAGLLLGLELPPPPGYHAEVGFSYATAARRYEIAPGREDLSDVTPKLVLVGLGGSREASGGLGAGTPASEWRIRVALGPSHDEQAQTPFSVANTTATGTGRYENFAIVLRHPLGSRDSLEAAWNRRTHKATDLINIGNERFFFTEERVLSAERVDIALGLRHRWVGFEAALSGRYVAPSASDTTARLSQLTEGAIYGGVLEARLREGRWTLAASAERASGSIAVHEENQPAFLAREFDGPTTLEAYRLGLGYAAKSTEVFFQATYDRSRLPFVAFAVLGTEISAFESGYHPESRAQVYLWDLTVRQTLAPGFRVKVLLRSSRGDETLTLTDPTGALPARRLDIQRSGVFGAGLSHLLGGPEVTLGVGAEIALPIGK
jgi:hypothetical protein